MLPDPPCDVFNHCSQSPIIGYDYCDNENTANFIIRHVIQGNFSMVIPIQKPRIGKRYIKGLYFLVKVA